MTTPKLDMQVVVDETAAYLDPRPYQAALKHARDNVVTLPQNASFDDVRKALIAGRAVRFEQPTD